MDNRVNDITKESKTGRDALLFAAGVICSVGVMLWAGFSGVDRAYLYAVILMCLFILVPFYISFEKGEPYAREIVLVSVMIALAVAGRAAFFWAPQFKPIIAIVIISGIALGARNGFVIGSMSAFVSNFFFGQGPWTPFQMVAWGLIGFFAGVLFSEKGRSLLPILIYGALSCFVLHGAITDIWTVLSITDKPNLGTITTVYLAGLIPDLILAVATVLFLSLMTRPMLKKISRVKTKYNL
ncbi:MAG: ECF transporter S component [Firmicutes bacterium]|nr:ECF transporter S component [Bacillota bacterium]